MYHHFSFCLGIPWRRVGKLAWVSAAYAFFFHMFAFFDGRRSPPRISMTDGSQHSTWPKLDSLPEAFIVYFKHSTKRVNKLDDTHLPSDNGGRNTWCRDGCIYGRARDLVQAWRKKKEWLEAQRYHIGRDSALEKLVGWFEEPSFIAFASSPLDQGVWLKLS